MLTRHVLICCKYLLSRNFLSNAVIFSCGDVGISALFTLYWVKMELILLAKLSCPCSASVKSSSYIRFIIHSLGILKMRNQYLISWSCCLRCNGNCPVSTYTARSGVLCTEAYIRHFQMRYYLNLVNIITRYEIIIAWYEIIKAWYAIIITCYAILQRHYAIFITRSAIIKF